MIFEEFIRQPYDKRRLVVFTRDTLEISKQPLARIIRSARRDIDQFPLLLSWTNFPFGEVSRILLPLMLFELQTLLSKRARDITYIPYKSIGLFRLPKGEVREGVIYVGHPLATEFLSYYPIDEFHQSLHKQKSHELVRILNSMNLKRFTIKHLQGYRDISGFSGNIGGKAGKAKLSAGVGYNKRSNEQFDVLWDVSTKVVDEKPILPSDLVWYDYEEDWQLAMQIVMDERFERLDFKYSYKNDFGIDLKLKLVFDKYKADAQHKRSSFQDTLWGVTIER